MAGRFDYFPRSILEIWDETALASKQQLVVEDKLLPAATPLARKALWLDMNNLPK